MSAKDRTTAYVCSNADGSEKLPLAIIGTAKNPRCFRLGSPPVPYFSNKTAGSTSLTFSKLVKLRISTPHSLFHLQKRGFVGGQRWVTF